MLAFATAGRVRLVMPGRRARLVMPSRVRLVMPGRRARRILVGFIAALEDDGTHTGG